MRIAIVGASSQIGKDLIRSFANAGRGELLLYARDKTAMTDWVEHNRLRDFCSIHHYDSYGESPHEIVMNFVGVGDPLRATEIGSSICETTSRFDDMIMSDLSRNTSRRYFFLSSGAVYGNVFDKPVTPETQAIIPINNIRLQNLYATAKLTAELKHRSRLDLSIIDLRVFNMFSRTQNIESRFFITDIVRAIRDNNTLQTTAEYIVRDFMHPSDFHKLVECLISIPSANFAVDCYSREPVDKPTLLRAMNQSFGLAYQTIESPQVALNATGIKRYYYSVNKKAAEFGYQPTWSSLDGIREETSAILRKRS